MMENKWYFKLQLLGYELGETPDECKTNALKDFCEALQVSVHAHQSWPDTFYVPLPDDEYDACEIINAIQAYCYFHNIARRLASEKVTVPLDEFLKMLSEID